MTKAIVTVSVDTSVIEAARKEGLNISAACNEALAQLVGEGAAHRKLKPQHEHRLIWVPGRARFHCQTCKRDYAPIVEITSFRGKAKPSTN